MKFLFDTLEAFRAQLAEQLPEPSKRKVHVVHSDLPAHMEFQHSNQQTPFLALAIKSIQWDTASKNCLMVHNGTMELTFIDTMFAQTQATKSNRHKSRMQQTYEFLHHIIRNTHGKLMPPHDIPLILETTKQHGVASNDDEESDHFVSFLLSYSFNATYRDTLDDQEFSNQDAMVKPRTMIVNNF